MCVGVSDVCEGVELVTYSWWFTSPYITDLGEVPNV